MGNSSTPDDADLVRYREIADELVAVAIEVLPPWVEGQVERIADLWFSGPGSGFSRPNDLAEQAADAGAAAAAEVGMSLRELLALERDQQTRTPLQVLRDAVSYPTAVLAAAGVPPLERDPDTERRFPGDVYDLTPGSFTEISPALQEPGLEWGAAVAHLHMRQHRQS